MTEAGGKSLGEEFLTRLQREPNLVRALKLTKTYERRLVEALKDPKMRAYLEDGVNTVIGLGVVPEGYEPDEAFLLQASAVINGRLGDKARWDAKNPGKPFEGYS